MPANITTIVIPGLTHPEGVSSEEPYGNYTPFMNVLAEASLRPQLAYPDWSQLPDPDYDLFEDWFDRIDEQVGAALDRNDQILVMTFSIGWAAFAHWAARNLPLFLKISQRYSPFVAVLSNSRALFDEDLYQNLISRKTFTHPPSDFLTKPSHIQRQLRARIPVVFTQHVPVHFTVAANERALCHIEAMREGIGHDNRTFGTVQNADHNPAAHPAYQAEVARLGRLAVQNRQAIFEERASTGPQVQIHF